MTPMQSDALFELLKLVHGVCIKNKLKPILTGSALIGIYRDKKLINCESIFNIDHATIKGKHEKLSLIFRAFGYQTRIFKGREKEKLIIADKKNGVRVQLLSFHKTKLYYFRRKKRGEIRCIPRTFYDDLGWIDFQGFRFICPRDIVKYLEYIYLDWKTPANMPAAYFRHDLVRTPEYMGMQFGFKKWSEAFYENNRASRKLLEKSRQKK
jgi:hypothetical protein